MRSPSHWHFKALDDRSLHVADSQGKHYGSIRLSSPEKNEQNIQRQMAWKGCQRLHLYDVSGTYFIERYAKRILKWNDYPLCGSNAAIPRSVLPAIYLYSKGNEFSRLVTGTKQNSIHVNHISGSSVIPAVLAPCAGDIGFQQEKCARSTGIAFLSALLRDDRIKADSGKWDCQFRQLLPSNFV